LCAAFANGSCAAALDYAITLGGPNAIKLAGPGRASAAWYPGCSNRAAEHAEREESARTASW